MALWRKNTALTEAEKERRRKKQEEKIIRRCSFYHADSICTTRPNEEIECASNRRAAGKYVPNH